MQIEQPIENSQTTFLKSLIALIAIAGLASSSTIFAQDADDVGDQADADSEVLQLEEVVVTARKRDESLQDVPISVTAFGAEYLVDVNVADITYISQSSPNTTLKVSRGTNSTLTAFIRGVGQQDPLVGFEPGVGLYLDDVYIARPQGAVFQVYDVERIEVLRGPQGTLYGRNTIGGAIKYITKRLAEEPEVKIELAAGSYRQLDGVFSGSTPLSETLRIGGSIASFNRDGFGKNLFTGGEHYDKDILSGRVSLEWLPTENFFLRLTADYTEDNSSPKSGYRQTVGNVSGAPVLDNVFDTRAGAEVSPSTAGIDGKNKLKMKGTSLLMEWYLNEEVTFKSITAYREDTTRTSIDFDGLPVMDFDAAGIYINDQLSQELQMLYTGDRLQGVFGLYYLDANAANDFDVVLGQLAQPFGITSYTFGEVNTKAWSVFGDLTWNIYQTLAFSVGGRYTNDKRTATILRQVFLGIGSPRFGNDGALLLVPSGDFTSSRTDKEFTPRASITWSPNQNHNLYLSYSEGFKGGGFDPRGNELVFPGVVEGYGPEFVDSWEVGIKSNWANGRATTAIALFTNDYTDQQIPGTVAIDINGDGIDDDFAGTVTNAGQSNINGFEFEGSVLVTKSLMLRGMVSYINAEFKEFIVNGENIANQRVFQNTPKWTAYAALDYRWDASFGIKHGEMGLIGSWSYKDDTFQFEIPTPSIDQQAYSLFNLSLIWSSDDGRYQFGLHGKNLTDKEYKIAGYYFPTLGLEGVDTPFYGNPRTFTATAQFKF